MLTAYLLDAAVVVPDENLGEWLSETAAYASVLGLQMKGQRAPATLFPVPLPASEFQRGRDLAPLFNILCHRIEHHPTFLKDTLKNVVKMDEFTAKLVEVYDIVHAGPLRQKMALYIDRSDYMLHNGTMKQVELNTISSAFGALSSRLSRLHRLLMSEALPSISLPENMADVRIAAGLAAANAACGLPGSVVMLVVQPDEGNAIDQRALQYLLWEKHGIRSVRRTLGEIGSSGSLEERTFALLLDKNIRVGVAYFRAGYTPRDYPSDAEWAARLLIEQSSAIRCPTIAHHLAGTKRVQQALSIPGCLEMFFPDAPDHCQVLRNVFAQQWCFEGSGPSRDVDELIRKALEAPGRYVLKPQREGGGNNFYGDGLVAQLKKLSREELEQYVLMERLEPRTYPTVVIKNNEHMRVQNSVSEFGFYSVWLGGNGDAPLINECAGYLVRTKALGVDEGGVATGFSVLDTPMPF
ncbi:Glutathione synthetase [Plasmodiophora brassicae]|nr:hypothetical protein PBRA_004952 [Plasmodiophora brassicae]